MSEPRRERGAGAGGPRHALRVGLLALLLPVSVIAAPLQPPTLIEYEIEDQFEQGHRDGELRDRVAVVIAAGRKGREFATPWGDAVRARLAGPLAAGRVAVLPVADLRGVPGFMKGRVRGRFPEEPERWILMDWDGRFAEAYELDEESVSLLLFGADGALITRMSAREVNQQLVEHLGALVDETLLP